MSTVDGWTAKKLRELADIRVSNVDKKSYPFEKPVRLCNYLDVYENQYITGNIEFMEASVTPAEIERFSLNPGDVVITKDSETPDDIGIPTVISEQIDGLVCGYHLALIRPNRDLIDPVYLAKQLSTSDVSRYFAVKASGSTRFGLPIDAIEGVEIPMLPRLEQAKIAEVLSTIDRAIEHTEAVIAKQQRIKTGLMQDLLTHGIDEHGNLRSEETHQFKDSPFGKIPVEWEVKTLDSLLVSKQYGISTSLTDEPIGTPVLRMNNLVNGRVDFTDLKYSIGQEAKNLTLNEGDVLFNRTNSIDYVGRTAIYHDFERPISFASYLVRLVPDRTRLHPEYLNLWLNDGANQIRVKQLATIGVQQANVNPTNLGRLSLAYPKQIPEQKRIIEVLSTASSYVSRIESTLRKLLSLRTALMQDLLTGKKRVTPLLTPAEV
jgi:type I restriction enzyme S subunit